ncbi:MAG: aminopeptidase [Myxococcota bacterium]
MGGCHGYLLEQADGQARVLLSARPVENVLADPATSADMRRRLRVAREARAYARDVLGLTVGQQYQRVVMLDRDALVYVVMAAPRTSLTPYTWKYPVVGELPYRGYFRRGDADAEAARLAREGYETAVRKVSTFSLLGYLPDPLVSSMLDGPMESVVETVIHELCHATVFVPSDAAFNESLCSFVGEEGRRRFLRTRMGPHSAAYALAEARARDGERYRESVDALVKDLRALFQGPLPDEEKAWRKDALYVAHQQRFERTVVPRRETRLLAKARLPGNNAELSQWGVYHADEAFFARELRAVQGDFPRFMRRMAARSGDAEFRAHAVSR